MTDYGIVTRSEQVPPLAAEIDRLRAENARLRDILSIIALNASMIPDPAMHGTTDTYSVPLDDIEAARAALAQ